ncbi:MAG: outer membrane beta-barrel protein [Nitrospirota bacterium]
MKKLTLLGYALALLLVSSTAWAGGDSGLYLGGSVGSSNIEVSGSGGSYDDNATAYKIFGGYNFGLVPLIDVAIEGSYVDFGTADGAGGETSVTGLDAFGLVGVNMGPISMFGKVGAVRWDTEVSGAADESGTDPAYGIGLQFQLLSIAIRAEYELFTPEDVDIGLASIGASYTF